MPDRLPVYFWKRTPFIRLIIPLLAGILIQFTFTLGFFPLLAIVGFIALLLFAFYLTPFYAKYTFRWVPGVAINLALIVAGALLVYKQDISNKQNWIGNYNTDTVPLLITLQEPLVEKAKTFKAEASVEAVMIDNEWKEATGKILVYFSKDNILKLDYGSQVILYKPLQEIKNSGNPGSFDYRKYNAFKGVFHQVFLKANEYVVTNTTNENEIKKWLFGVRFWVIQKLKKYIKGEREAAVAEALLIGYRDDLDKDLVQAYSNTGVVHIIAISGLHLGMIYMALVWLMTPFKRKKWIRWIRPLVILTVLWVFTLLAGGVPSILRSAVMFSFIVLGETLNRKSSIYNTLASSAFVMLCINPYYLFDIGFQLSYAAVVSIIAFQKTIYNWAYIQNKILNFFWKLTSVTLAAQILTVPIIFYAFHQFPTMFILTNIVVVPLSSGILFGELILVICSAIPVLAQFVGTITSSLLAIMNGFIERINRFPYAVYDGIQNSLVETIFLYLFIIAISYWLMNKTKAALSFAIAAMCMLIAIASIDNYKKRQQKKLIVYNIQQHTAIDFIAGKQYVFFGDSALVHDGYLNNFNLKPSRTLHKVGVADNLEDLFITKPFIQFMSKRILVIDRSYKFQTATKIPVDVIIVSHNPRLYISDVASVFDCKQYVFDASNSTWKIGQWKKDCDSLHLRNYSTPDNGAYILNL
jgi:competence protein ComEC